MKNDILLTKIYNNLEATGAVKNLADFANKLDRNYSVVSSAMNGRPQYLTPKLYKRVMEVFPQVNPEFVRTGAGEVLLGSHTPAQTVSYSTPAPQGQDFAEMLVRLLMSQKGKLELIWSAEGGGKTVFSVSQIQANA